MQKIGFNQHYGLHDAVVVTETKTKTRRLEKCLDKLYEAEERLGEPLVISEQQVVNEYLVLTKTNAHILYLKPRYKLGEVVAVAQSYKSIFEESLNYALPRYHWLDDHIDEKGFENKMFVKASEMPHQIEITGIRVERLQDITDKDCIAEGIINGKAISMYTFTNAGLQWGNPRLAFSALIDKPGVGGPGTWERNPWVLVYSFKKIK